MGKGKHKRHANPEDQSYDVALHMECTEHEFTQIAEFKWPTRFVSLARLWCPKEQGHEVAISFPDNFDRNMTDDGLADLLHHFPKSSDSAVALDSTVPYETVECRRLQPHRPTPDAVHSFRVSGSQSAGAVYEMFRVSYVPSPDLQDAYSGLPGSGLPPEQVRVPEFSYNAAMITASTHSNQYTGGQGAYGHSTEDNPQVDMTTAFRGLSLNDSGSSQPSYPPNAVPTSNTQPHSQNQPFTMDDARRFYHQVGQGGNALHYGQMSGSSTNSSIQATPVEFYTPQNALSHPPVEQPATSGVQSPRSSRHSRRTSRLPTRTVRAPATYGDGRRNGKIFAYDVDGYGSEHPPDGV